MGHENSYNTEMTHIFYFYIFLTILKLLNKHRINQEPSKPESTTHEIFTTSHTHQEQLTIKFYYIRSAKTTSIN